jgi:Protein of unknown function (DUF3738)
VDQTGLIGTFDFDVKFQREDDLENTSRSPFIRTAIQTLGLRVEAGKGPVELLVIDHLGKLSENWWRVELPGAIRKRISEELGDLLDFSIADARRADAHPTAGAIHQRADRLQVQVPASFRNVMSVADLIAENRLPAAYFTNLCHWTEISC